MSYIENIECDRWPCEAPDNETGITNCIHCGGELRQVGQFWFHWTQFDNDGKLLPDSRPQDYIKTKKQQ